MYLKKRTGIRYIVRLGRTIDAGPGVTARTVLVGTVPIFIEIPFRIS